MTHVDRLRALAKCIAIERKASVGGTGYIDDRVHPEARMTKGLDPHGRAFITLCVRTDGRDDRNEFHNVGVVTVFQRYSNDDTIVTQASNTWRAPNLFLSGAATDADLDMLERLVQWGKATRTVEGVAGGTLHERLEIVSPEDACVHADE